MKKLVATLFILACDLALANPLVRTSPVAKSVPFDNSTNSFNSTDVQSAIEEIKGSGKAGRKLDTDFTGTPQRTAVVTFVNAFPSNNYAVTVTGVDSRNWSIENKTAAGFTINSNAAQSLTGEVYWIANLYAD